MNKLRTSILLVALVLCNICLAQDEIKTLKEFTAEPDEVFFGHVEVFSELSKTLKKEIRDGLVTAENLKPKKVGLITTYLFEEKFTFRKAHILYLYSKEGETNYFFNKMAIPLVEGLKEAFNGSGIELYTPSEFIESSADQESYEKLAKKLRTGDPFAQTARDMKLDPSGGEFEFIYTLSKDGESSKIMDELAEFAQSQGMDALLSVEINTKYMTKSVTFNALQLTLHGMNPDDKKGLLFNRYSLFSDMYYPVAFIKGGKLEWEEFTGFQKLGERAGQDYLKYIDETITETL